jgi:CheY-like chemotaxis protein/anti-sigma regulatory factor (Ser/Thr protein kinase)
LRQIVSNLLSNAIKFTRHGKVSLEITRQQASVEASPDKAALRIVVSDTGIGVPADMQDQIFESFTQVENFKTRRVSGTGLGLAITRRLLVLMGGQIAVSSAAGEGSVFTVILPVTQAQAPTLIKARTHAPVPESIPARKILLADDDQRGRAVAQKLLERSGYMVTAVENGSELLDALQQGAFDIVLTDISMPDMDGTQVAKIIRSGERAGIDRCVPIIAMTAHALTEDRDRFLASGIDGFVAKPFNFAELLRQIEELCSRRTG